MKCSSTIYPQPPYSSLYYSPSGAIFYPPPPSTTLIPRIAFPVVLFLLLSWLTPFNLLQFLLLIPPFALLGAISLLRELSYGVLCLSWWSVGVSKHWVGKGNSDFFFLDYTITVHIR